MVLTVNLISIGAQMPTRGSNGNMYTCTCDTEPKQMHKWVNKINLRLKLKFSRGFLFHKFLLSSSIPLSSDKENVHTPEPKSTSTEQMKHEKLNTYGWVQMTSSISFPFQKSFTLSPNLSVSRFQIFSVLLYFGHTLSRNNIDLEHFQTNWHK